MWLEQPVDHFDQSDQRTWKQKYYKSTDSWKPGGPILIYLNGEESLKQDSINGTYEVNDGGLSLTDQIVRETNAAYFILEHRYYGDSQPFEEFTIENMAFLTSKQALADAALLLKTMKESPEFENSKVIVIGGSYAGNLAAWMKVMYPNMVDAVLASSAPVLAKKDFSEYVETVTDTFKTYGSQECVNNISDKFNRFRELLKTSEGIEQLKEEQSICKDVDMTVPENQQYFLSAVMFQYCGIAQYGSPSDVAYKCENNKLYFSLKQEMPFIWNNESNCANFDFNKMKDVYNDNNRRSWLYQTCTEFGYFQSTTSSQHMFGQAVPVDFYYKTCSLVFGEQFNEQRVDEGVVNTNNIYGGLTPNVKQVVFVNGDMDPWHRLGVLQNLSDDVPVIYISGSSHCYDLHPDSDKDNDSVKEARTTIKKLLKQWIGAQ